MTVLWLCLTLAAAPIDSIATISLGEPERMPDCYQYRVGFFRPVWRSDWLLHRVVANGDTLGDYLTVSDLDRLMASVSLPDTAQVELTTWLIRIEQRPNGRRLRGPMTVEHPNVDDLWRRHRRDLGRLDRPTAASLPYRIRRLAVIRQP